MRLPKVFGKSIRLGRVGLPLWALALAGAAIVAAAGQAVGPVLSGSVTGSAGLTTEQAIALNEGGTFTIDGANEALGVINDEGTSFTVALEYNVGDTAVIKLPVKNVSDAPGNAILELNVPAGVDVEVDTSIEPLGDLKEAQMSKNAWLLYVANGNTETLNISVSPKDDLAPGFYTISGRIVQITG